MSIIEESPLSIETPAIPAHGMNIQANTISHYNMGASALRVEGITHTQRYVTK